MKLGKVAAVGFLVWLAWQGLKTIARIEGAGSIGGSRNVDPSTGRPLF